MPRNIVEVLRRRLPARLSTVGMCAALAVLAAGCGEELADDDFGGVDLQPFYADTATGRVPAFIQATRGYHDGQRSNYYNFGTVAVQVGRASPKQQEEYGVGGVPVPQTAYVNPMYFFFDANGRPLFSWPVREVKTGNFYMQGGEQVRDPNPDPDAPRNLAYPARARKLLVDPGRNSADYQRPIIDNIFEDIRIISNRGDWRYTGLWEVYKVRAPAGYRPDAIKSWRTLERGWDKGNGEFRIEATGMPLDCPLVDSRTLIRPTVAAFAEFEPRVPQPLVELWYRRKRVNCFLVHGWEALGAVTMDPMGQGNDTYERYTWGQDSRRLATFDVETKVIGQGVAEKRQTVAPVGRIFSPVIPARGGPGVTARPTVMVDTFSVTTGAYPRRSPADPPGYRPFRWLWGIDVGSIAEIGLEFDERWYANLNNATPELTNLALVDRAKLSPLTFTISRPRPDGSTEVANEPLILNFPMTGRRISCKALIDHDKDMRPGDPPDDPCPKIGLVCPLNQKFLHSDEWCQPKRVAFGEYCAPTVADCFTRVDTMRTEPFYRSPPGPPGSVERANNERRRVLVSKGDTVEEWFFLRNPPIPDCGDERDQVLTAGLGHDDLRTKQCFQEPQGIYEEFSRRVPADWQIEQSLLPGGFIATPGSGANAVTYTCRGDAERGLGHCYMACDGGQANRLQGESIEYEIPGTGRKVPMRLDSRCGGARMPGYRCLPITNRLTEGGGSYCARECDPTLAIADQDAVCQKETPIFYTDTKNVPGDGTTFHPVDIAAGTRCTARRESGVSYNACLFDVGMEPR